MTRGLILDTKPGTAMTRQQFLTVRWNNLLVLGLGLPMLLYVAVVMATAAMPAGASFAGLMVIGVFY